MSLTDVDTIDALKIDVTPNGGVTSSREYVARNVQVQRLWRGEQWMTSDFVNNIHTHSRHLIFTLSGSDIDQVSDTGNYRDPILLSEDLIDPEGFTVEIYPDAGQSKKFEVIAFNPDRFSVLELTNMARTDEDSIQCITKEKVSRADVEWFRKGFQTATIFVDNGMADDLVTFTRASKGWYFGSDGLLKEAAVDAMRFEYDPASGELLGLLVEEERTNSVPDSRDMTTASWTEQGELTVTRDQTGIDGQSNTACLLTKGGLTENERVYRGVSVTNGSTYTISAFVKWVDAVTTTISFRGTTLFRVNINWDGSGGITSVTNNAGTTTNEDFEQIEDGWYRVYFTFTADTTETGNAELDIDRGAGLNTNSVIVDQYQFEAGSFASSPIVTGPSAVTRSVDVATVMDLAWYSQDEGTFVVEFETLSNTTDQEIFAANEDSSNRNQLRITSAGDLQYQVQVSGINVVIISKAISGNTFYKVATGYKQDDFAMAVDAAVVGTDTSGGLTAPTTLRIGKGAQNQQFNGHIKRLHYYPDRLSNAKLKQLTR